MVAESDVDIDVIAGFVIVNKERNFYFLLDKADIMDYIEVNGIKIPLQSVMDKLKAKNVKVYRTDQNRIIILTEEGKDIKL